jgi:hypothetical protein
MMNPPRTALMNLDELLQFSQKRASEIIGATEPIREEFRSGRPNSSDESTTKGVLATLEVILSQFPQKKV